MMFQAIIEDREPPKTEKVIDGYTGFLFYDNDGNPLVAIYCSNMAKSGINPKTLQYLMGHSDISVTVNIRNPHTN